MSTATVAFDLTTVFTPPASCFAPTYTLPPAGNDEYVSSDFNNGSSVVSVVRGYQSNCFPPNFLLLQQAQATSTLSGTLSYYSPGLCPASYQTLVAETRGDLTEATCCPLGCTLTGSQMRVCKYSVAYPDGYSVTILDSTSSTVVDWGDLNGVYAPPLYVAYAASDLSLLQTASSTSTSTSTPTPAPSASLLSPTATATTPSASASSSNQLSTGSKAGIGVGVAAAVVIIAALLLFLFFRRRKQRARMGGVPGNARDQPELDGEGNRHEVSTANAVYEANDGQVHEVNSADAKRDEIVGTEETTVAELDGDWKGQEADVGQREEGKVIEK